jgi:hypothetical protein
MDHVTIAKKIAETLWVKKYFIDIFLDPMLLLTNSLRTK